MRGMDRSHSRNELLTIVFFVGSIDSELSAQQRTLPPKPPVLPANMDCERLKGDKEITLWALDHYSEAGSRLLCL